MDITNDDLAPLRRRYPSWAIGSTWASRPSAGDYRIIYAECDGYTLRAFDVESLAAQLSDADGYVP